MGLLAVPLILTAGFDKSVRFIMQHFSNAARRVSHGQRCCVEQVPENGTDEEARKRARFGPPNRAIAAPVGNRLGETTGLSAAQLFVLHKLSDAQSCRSAN